MSVRTVRATVVGSTNVDLVHLVDTLPRPGETVISSTFRREPGGKGANQAVALARLGAQVRFVSAVGDDDAGRYSLDLLAVPGLDLSDVAVTPMPTGQAIVLVDARGENCIVVSVGANAFVTAPDHVDADVLVLSLEVPISVVAATASRARRLGVPVVLNAAPATDLPPALLADVDVLVVNETEWAALGRPSAGRVVVTRGAVGCLAVEDGRTSEVPAVPVTVVDTTGAGDCFAAALAWQIGSGAGLVDGARFAVRAAALSVTRQGARGLLPTRAQIDALR